MFGSNPKLPPERGDGLHLKVHKIFPTFQGEGPFVGYPSVFIRLAGCNLACAFCDTDFDSYEETAIESIFDQLQTLKCTASPLIVITGGEPFRQNIGPLCEFLLSKGLKVQIETNGTLYRSIPKDVSIVCSPKCSIGSGGVGYHAIRHDILAQCVAMKFIISAHQEGYDKVAEIGQEIYNIPVYLQPMDEYDPTKNRANLMLAMELANRHGYILGSQMHKIIGVD